MSGPALFTVQAAAAAIRSAPLSSRRPPSSSAPACGLYEMKIETEIPYGEIPDFRSPPSRPTPPLLRHLGGRKVVAMQGRFHAMRATPPAGPFPVRVLHALGRRS
jgi:hypothetical protein